MKRRDRRPKLLGAVCFAALAFAGLRDLRSAATSFVAPRGGRLGERAAPLHSRQASAAPSASTVVDGSPFVGPVSRTGGGGGGGPTPAEVAQVVVYRLALVLGSLCWLVTFNLDFFMRGGLSGIIDGSLQRQALALADVCAGIAAAVVPTGSRLVVGLLLRALGVVTLAAAATGSAGLDSLGSLCGPMCIILICAREIYWFGLREKGSAAVCAVLFLIVGIFRATVVTDPTSPLLNPEDNGEEFSWIQRGIPCIGPPILLSFPTTLALTGLAFSKVLLESVADDLNEEGELWSKPTSEDDEDESEVP